MRFFAALDRVWNCKALASFRRSFFAQGLHRIDVGGASRIAEGVALLETLKSRRFGAYTLQAAIAAVHAEAESSAVTDWRQIVALYDRRPR
jgi:hypothetical protein